MVYAALRDRLYIAPLGADVQLPRPPDLVLGIGDHLVQLRDPPDGARKRKDRGEKWHRLGAALKQSATRWALLAGLCISLYTTIDKAGVGLAPSLLYTYLAMTLTLVYLTPAVLATVGWRGVWAEWRASKLSTLLAGGSAMAAYAIVLYVMQTGVQASYVSATREISVVFGTVLGAAVLKESAGPMRVFGAVLITLGVAVTGLLA